ncbi:MAG: nicotinate-nucleotide adenylyltransferase, partial [Candidatus Omnitrophica bacterium]|nr:nicotinate-nucleotide adenylyltransferase [Candidatus Omnitrophota bacterium]
LFVPAYLPPHKKRTGIARAADRLAMVKLAIKDNGSFAVSDVEIKRKGRSYTIDTLQALKRLYARDDLYFITGSDLMRYLPQWKDLRDILTMVKFVVATRPGYPLEKIPSYITKVSIRAVDISGVEIRRAIKDGHSIRYLVPDPVFSYITKKRVYR